MGIPLSELPVSPAAGTAAGRLHIPGGGIEDLGSVRRFSGCSRTVPGDASRQAGVFPVPDHCRELIKAIRKSTRPVVLLWMGALSCGAAFSR